MCQQKNQFICYTIVIIKKHKTHKRTYIFFTIPRIDNLIL